MVGLGRFQYSVAKGSFEDVVSEGQRIKFSISRNQFYIILAVANQHDDSSWRMGSKIKFIGNCHFILTICALPNYKIFITMKAHILALLFAMFLLTALAADNSGKAGDDEDDDDDDDITTLTFLIEYEPEPDNDYIEIGLTVEARGSSLKTAIQKVTEIVNQIENVAETFCQENPEEGANCQEVVDVEDFEISAEYATKRKEEVFQQFVVTHQVTVRVDNTDKIGELGDKLLKTENTKIQSFDWASNDEDEDEEEAIEAGKDKAEDMCFHLGMKLHRIVAVQAVEQEDDNAGGGEDEEEDEEDEEDGPLVYRFEVECIADVETAAKKEAEEAEEDRLEAEEQEKEKKKEEEEEETQRKEKEKKKEKAKPAAEKQPAGDKKKKK